MSTGQGGYGKPPKKHQFKKGQSGNPKGRPKGVKSLKTALKDELDMHLRIKEGGKQKSVSKMEALTKRLVTDALNGNPRALVEVLRQINLHLADTPDVDPATTEASPRDIELLMRFAERFAAAKGSADDA